MARVKCLRLARFTLLEIDNECLIKNAENNQNVFYFQESKEGLGGYYK
ncbi:MAG: hypothetical protein ACO2PP_17705 [Thermocrinis sp.]|jgi:hypothetical protein